MFNDWQYLDGNRLRAHLVNALSEREAGVASEDFGYGDEEFEALTLESTRRLFRINSALRRSEMRGKANDQH